MIKTYSFLFVILFSVSCIQQTQSLSESEKSQIKEQVQSSFESLTASTKEQNWDAYFDHFDQNNFSGINADGTTWESFEEFEASVSPAFDMIESSDSLSFPIVKISVINNSTAVLVNEYQQKITLTTGDTIWAYGAGTQVWSKETGAWKLVSVSASSK